METGDIWIGSWSPDRGHFKDLFCNLISAGTRTRASTGGWCGAEDERDECSRKNSLDWSVGKKAARIQITIGQAVCR